MGDGIAGVVDMLCAPAEGVGTFDILEGVVEEEDLIAGGSDSALKGTKSLFVWLGEPEEVAGVFVFDHAGSREVFFHACPVGGVGVRKEGGGEVGEAVEFFDKVLDAFVFFDEPSIMNRGDILDGVEIFGFLGDGAAEGLVAHLPGVESFGQGILFGEAFL